MGVDFFTGVGTKIGLVYVEEVFHRFAFREAKP